MSHIIPPHLIFKTCSLEFLSWKNDEEKSLFVLCRGPGRIPAPHHSHLAAVGVLPLVLTPSPGHFLLSNQSSTSKGGWTSSSSFKTILWLAAQCSWNDAPSFPQPASPCRSWCWPTCPSDWIPYTLPVVPQGLRVTLLDVPLMYSFFPSQDLGTSFLLLETLPFRFSHSTGHQG